MPNAARGALHPVGWFGQALAGPISRQGRCRELRLTDEAAIEHIDEEEMPASTLLLLRSGRVMGKWFDRTAGTLRHSGTRRSQSVSGATPGDGRWCSDHADHAFFALRDLCTDLQPDRSVRSVFVVYNWSLFSVYIGPRLGTQKRYV